MNVQLGTLLLRVINELICIALGLPWKETGLNVKIEMHRDTNTV